MCERERSAAALTEAKLREGERTVEERQRIARDLHDSVSQALFSTLLHTRIAQRRCATRARRLRTAGAGAEHDRRPDARGAERDARVDLRARPGSAAGGLVPALARHVAKVAEQDGIDVRLEAPDGRLALAPRTEAHLFGIAREALANSVKHSGRATAWVRLAGAAGARAARGRRRRPRLRSGGEAPRALRPRVDAHPGGRDRRATDDLERRGRGHGRARGAGGGADG